MIIVFCKLQLRERQRREICVLVHHSLVTTTTVGGVVPITTFTNKSAIFMGPDMAAILAFLLWALTVRRLSRAADLDQSI